MSQKKYYSHRSLRSRLDFLIRFIMQPHTVGSIWPSSECLGRAMLHNIEWHPGDLVVEYGPGTGPFTNLLRHYLPQGIRYLGIEYDLHLCNALRHRFPEMQFHHGSAEETVQLLEQYRLGPARLILSGLPFANMTAALQENILTATKQSLQSDGLFRTFTYFGSTINPRARCFQKRALHYFQPAEKSRIVLGNFPPARILSYTH